jgi:DNA-binding MarR family transcriptional regulator
MASSMWPSSPPTPCTCSRCRRSSRAAAGGWLVQSLCLRTPRFSLQSSFAPDLRRHELRCVPQGSFCTLIYIVIRYTCPMRQRAPRAIDYKALADFRYEIRSFLNFSETIARSERIEPQQHQALLAIKGEPLGSETTVGVLAKRLQIRHHSAVELSRRLEATGWIRRSRHGADRRQVQLVVTPSGERLLAKLSVSHRRELRTAGPRLLRALQTIIARRKNPRRQT